jgi:hypothetical protein
MCEIGRIGERRLMPGEAARYTRFELALTLTA